MKKLILLILLSLFFVITYAQIKKTTGYSNGSDFYIISINGTADVKEAAGQVKALKAKGHPAGYLWIPEYPSLSKKELYSVFIGPFSNIDTTILYLENYKKSNPKAYAVKVGKTNERVTIMGKYDIRKNDLRQFLILIYSTPEDEEAYTGEDWGWFVNDVSTYFSTQYPDKVYIGSVYGSWFTKQDIKDMKQELDLEGFGYVLINGKKKLFLNHQPSSGVIAEACDFFGLENKEMEYGD
jgi:hypothetical protein